MAVVGELKLPLVIDCTHPGCVHKTLTIGVMRPAAAQPDPLAVEFDTEIDEQPLRDHADTHLKGPDA